MDPVDGMVDRGGSMDVLRLYVKEVILLEGIGRSVLGCEGVLSCALVCARCTI